MKTVYEYVGNMHMHTPYSDGAGSHADIAQAALKAGLDFLIVTDHNVRVDGVEGYYYGGAKDRRVLVMVGEEVHDPRRDPQVNHMLIYGSDQELAGLAADPQDLIDEVRVKGGICYLAHPIERAAPLFNEDALPWVEWDIEGYTGIELWNYMSEFKSYLTSRTGAVQAAFDPDRFISGPFPETLALWDNLLAEGHRVKIIGGSDAHANTYSLGPLKRKIFPYEYLFRCVNTHILCPAPLTGDHPRDRLAILAALREGTTFVGYDLPASTRGFRFSAQGRNTAAVMGEWISLGHGITIQIGLPHRAEMRLLRNGKIILTERESTHRTFIATEPGAYRVEAYIEYRGKRRGWIFSNPIFVE